MEIILRDMIKIVLGFILGILSFPIKRWIHSSNKEICAYDRNKIPNPSLKEIIVTKIFGKTSHINCYWFNRREEKEIDGIKYMHCLYGNKFLTQSGKGASKCPFI